jgi:hypothetical protein
MEYPCLLDKLFRVKYRSANADGLNISRRKPDSRSASDMPGRHGEGPLGRRHRAPALLQHGAGRARDRRLLICAVAAGDVEFRHLRRAVELPGLRQLARLFSEAVVGS